MFWPRKFVMRNESVLVPVLVAEDLLHELVLLFLHLLGLFRLLPTSLLQCLDLWGRRKKNLDLQCYQQLNIGALLFTLQSTFTICFLLPELGSAVASLSIEVEFGCHRLSSQRLA